MNGSPLPVPAPATASVTPRRLSVGVMVLVAVTTLVACGLVTTAALLALIPGRALPLLTQRLPGLEVGLPPGHYDRSAIGAYRNGKLTVKASALRSLEVAVEWEPGEGMDDDDMQRVAGALSALIPGNVHDVQRNVPVPAPGLSRPP